MSYTPKQDGTNVYYVGKHGNDDHDGLSWGQAMLTFGAAITAANGQTPGAANVFSIVCEDGGIYSENITTISYVNIFAPKAQLLGTLTLLDNVSVYAHTIKNTAAGAIVKSAGSSASFVRAKVIETTGAHDAIVVSSASATCWVAVDVDYLTSVDGDMLTVSGAGAFAFVNARLAYCTGNGDCLVASAAASTIRGHVDYLLGLGTSVGIKLLGNGIATLDIGTVGVTGAYDVAAGSSLSLTVSSLSGTEVGAGTIVVNNASVTQTHIDGDGSDHADVASNTTHRGTDGTADHSQVSTNKTHVDGDGSDHADVATNTTALSKQLVQRYTTVGGSATETFTLTGILTGKPILAVLNVKGASPVTIVRADYNAADTIEVEFSGDPSSDHTLSVYADIT